MFKTKKKKKTLLEQQLKHFRIMCPAVASCQLTRMTQTYRFLIASNLYQLNANEVTLTYNETC